MKKRDCKFEKKISAFLDNELSSEEHKDLQAHIQNCNICQNKLRELREVNRFLSDYEEEEIPDRLQDKLLDALTQKNRENRISLRKVVNFPIAAMLLLSLISGIVISTFTFSDMKSETYAEFGEESYYTYFTGEDDV